MIKDIKAPQQLKDKTIRLMENKSEKPHYISHKKLIIVCAAMIIPILGFTYSKFSSLDGDNLKTSAKYIDNGVINIEITNMSDRKNLRLSPEIKLMRWSTAEEIGTYTAEIPKIEHGETESFSLFIDDYEEKNLLEPVPDNDWYYLVFTNNGFTHGQDWYASFRFETEESASEAENKVPVKPNEVFPYAESSENSVDNIEKDKNITYFINNNFSLTNPLDECEITDKFSLQHKHINLKGFENMPVHAICDGKAVRVEFDKAKGNIITIDHGNGFLSTYFHLENITVNAGDIVTCGQTIGTVGKSGLATGYSLGMETILNDEPFDAELILNITE